MERLYLTAGDRHPVQYRLLRGAWGRKNLLGLWDRSDSTDQSDLTGQSDLTALVGLTAGPKVLPVSLVLKAVLCDF